MAMGLEIWADNVQPLWCPNCFLPSGLSVKLLIVTRDGVRPTEARHCPDCKKGIPREDVP
jgi:hypothetical protein